MNEAFFEPYVPTFKARFDELETLDASALARGSFSLVLIPESCGETARMSGKFMNAFRKQADGSWKYTHAIWNLDGPQS
jgi:ketosteroid isomerase-like protein